MHRVSLGCPSVNKTAKEKFQVSNGSRATKGGGGLNGCATKEKYIFFNVRKKVPMTTKPRGGG